MPTAFAMIIVLALTLGLMLGEVGRGDDSTAALGLVAIGFMLLVGHALGAGLRRLHLPALLGYVAVGLLFSSHLWVGAEFGGVWGGRFGGWAFGRALPPPLDAEVLDSLSLIRILMIGIVGLAAGGRLCLRDLSGELRLVGGALLWLLFIVAPLVTGAVLLLAHGALPTPVLAIFHELTLPQTITAAVLIGLLTIGVSTPATATVLQEVGAKGRLTTLVMAVALAAEMLLGLTFPVVLEATPLWLPDSAMPWHASMPTHDVHLALLHIIAALGARVALILGTGVGAGLVLLLFVRFVPRAAPLATTALILAGAWLTNTQEVDALVSFFVAGLLLRNVSARGEEWLTSMEQVGTPAFILYFALLASQLEPRLFIAVWPAALVVVGVRVLVLLVGMRYVVQKLGDVTCEERHLPLGMVAQGASVIALGSLAADVFTTSFGAELRALVVVTAAMQLVLGPVLLRFALHRVGETARAQREGLQKAQTVVEVLPCLSTEDGDEPEGLMRATWLPTPDFPDVWLRERIIELRSLLIELYVGKIEHPVLAYHDRHAQLLEVIDRESRRALTDLARVQAEPPRDSPTPPGSEDVAPNDDILPALDVRIEQIRSRWRDALEPFVVQVREGGALLSLQAMTELLEAVLEAEDPRSAYRVERELQLFEPKPDDGAGSRVIKAVRRLRRRVAGPGYRVVPLGKIWQFHLALSLPEQLSGAAWTTASRHEAFWIELVRGLRRIDQLLVPRLADDASSHGDAAPSSPRTSESELDAMLGKLRESLLQLRTGALEHGRFAIHTCFSRLDEALHRAGTWELRDVHYRPSLKIDAARVARNRMAARLRLEEKRVTGLRGWVVIDHEVARLEAWCRGQNAALAAALDGMLRVQCAGSVRVLQQICAGAPSQPLVTQEDEPPASDVSAARRPWGQGSPALWYDAEVRPALHHAREMCSKVSAAFATGRATRRLGEALEARIAAFPDDVLVLKRDPEDRTIDDDDGDLVLVPLRAWFQAELVREISLRFVELGQQAQAALLRLASVLDGIDAMLAFHVGSTPEGRPELQGLAPTGDAQVAADEFAESLRRAERQLDQAASLLLQEEERLRVWLLETAGTVLDAALTPILDRRLQDIGRRLVRRGAPHLLRARGEGVLSRRVTPLIRRLSLARVRGMTMVRDVRRDVNARLLMAPPVPSMLELEPRVRWQPPGQRLPSSYRRLFAPLPLEIQEFYVPRPVLESRVATALSSFRAGHPTSLLLHGDRGSGRRTLVSHLLQHGRSAGTDGPDAHARTIQLPDTYVDEARLCAELAVLVDERAASLGSLSRALVRSGERRIVVLENADQLVLRSPHGLQSAAAILDFFRRTESHVLWVVLMGTPAAMLLDGQIGLLRRFSDVVPVTALDETGIEQLIWRRHRVSGFDLSFRSPAFSMLSRVLSPRDTREAARDPRRAYFASLARRSRGNPLEAMRQWLESVELMTGDETRMIVAPLPTELPRWLPGVAPEQRLVLAALAQHRTLSRQALASLLRLQPSTLQVALSDLARLGLVEVSTRADKLIRMTLHAEPQLTHELREEGLV